MNTNGGQGPRHEIFCPWCWLYLFHSFWIPSSTSRPKQMFWNVRRSFVPPKTACSGPEACNAYQPETFQYNRSFTERPSNLTDAAWHSLFPRQGGYFRHPEVAPSRSALAVFHQLHCLVSGKLGIQVLSNSDAPLGCNTPRLLGSIRRRCGR
jgi:hypothetical protein